MEKKRYISWIGIAIIVLFSISLIASITLASHLLSSSSSTSAGTSDPPAITIVRKTNPDIQTIFTVPIIVEDAFIAKMSDAEALMERINMTKTPSIGMATTYLFSTNKGLSNGNYNFVIHIKTLSGNRQVYEEPFEIDTPQTEITILEPRLGVSNDLDFSFTILTMREGERVPSRCKYSIFKAASFESAGLKMFDYPRDGGASETHTITSFMEKFVIEPNKPASFLYFYCIDDLGIEVQKTVQPAIDTIPPRITAVSLEPALWAEFPTSGPFFTTLNVETNEKALCKYMIRNAADYVAEVRYDSMAAFSGFDRFNESAFATMNRIWIELPNRDQVHYNLTTQCEDKAGLFTTPQSALMTVNLTSPLGILVTSPPPITSQSSITFEFTTKKTAYCTYGASDGTEVTITEASNPQKDHSFDYGAIEDGEYTFQLSCQSGSAGRHQQEHLDYEFTVDSVPPTTPNITAATFVTCQNTSFSESMNIRFSAQDARTGIARYYYRIPGIIQSFTESAGRLPPIMRNENGSGFVLVDGRTYTLEVIAQDLAGLNSTRATGTLLYDLEAWECLEHDPPVIEIDEQQQLGTVLVSMSCDDDSGCDNRSFKYGLAGSERNCTSTLTYDDPVLVSRPSYICFYAKDMVGNNATKSTRVVVIQASSCSNKVADAAETDVDCGGSCGGTCEKGKKCKANSDCKTDYCTAAGICDIPSCTDKIKNQHETDIDCGGECGDCGTGKACKIDTDCLSGLCSPTSKMCVESTCSDSIKGPGEADVDCGGTCPTKCATGKTCKLNSDCTTMYCNQFYNECRAQPTNGTEPPGPEPPEDKKGMLLWILIGVGVLFLAIGGVLFYHARYGKKTLQKQSRLAPPQAGSLSKKEKEAVPPAILRATRYHEELVRKRQEVLQKQRMDQRHSIFKAFNVSGSIGKEESNRVAGKEQKSEQKQGVGFLDVKKSSKASGKELPLHRQLFDKLKGEEWIPIELLRKKQSSTQQNAQQKQALAEKAAQEKQALLKQKEREQDGDFERLEALHKKREKDEFFDELENMKVSLNKALGGVLGEIGTIAEGKEKTARKKKK